MIIFSSIIRVYSLYIRINGDSLYVSVLACSLDCMAAQTRPNQKKGNSYIDLKSKINIELILLTFSVYYSRRRCMIRASICCPLKISKSKHSKSAGV